MYILFWNFQDNRIRAAAIDVHENEPYNVFSGESTWDLF